MKKTSRIRSALLVLLAMLMLFAAMACAKNNETPAINDQTSNEAPNNEGEAETPGEVEKKGAWESAVYLSDKEFGNGAKTLKITVKAEGQAVVFTLHSDKETVGAALLEHGLIAGEEGPYGLYVKTVNGMLADWNVDGTYWGFFRGTEYMSTGVDTTAFADGDQFTLEKTK